MSSQNLTRRLESSVPQVWSRLCDPAVTRRRADLAPDASVTLHETEGDRLLRAGVDTPVPEKWMPSMVRGRLGRGGFGLPTVRRVEEWRYDPAEAIDGSGNVNGSGIINGSMTIDIDGVPADASCRMSLTPEDSGTLARFDLSLSVHIPLVGRAVEATVLPQILKVLGKELDVLDGQA